MTYDGRVPCGEPLDAELAEILALSATMLDAARDQDWVTVANLESARGALLRAVLEGGARPAAETVATVLQQVLAADRELIALGESAHAAMAGQLGALRRGRSARSAYLDSGHD
jgi:hypothetical protein